MRITRTYYMACLVQKKNKTNTHPTIHIQHKLETCVQPNGHWLFCLWWWVVIAITGLWSLMVVYNYLVLVCR